MSPVGHDAACWSGTDYNEVEVLAILELSRQPSVRLLCDDWSNEGR
jgi:hypothetical protein